MREWWENELLGAQAAVNADDISKLFLSSKSISCSSIRKCVQWALYTIHTYLHTNTHTIYIYVWFADYLGIQYWEILT